MGQCRDQEVYAHNLALKINNTWIKDISALMCSLQHYLQCQDTDITCVHQWLNG